ncbi:MAG: hypothetical protein CSA33_02510 [Desulfobulbus propionicus]|nr:MAG: hypothetical protein CSA33_02510 [Desulfobulbus propionicus]
MVFLATFSPEHGKADHSFGEVMSWLIPFFNEERKARLSFVLEMAPKPPRITVKVTIQCKKATKPSIQ